jgi:hypothetical protein
MCVAELEACFHWGTKGTQVFVEGYILGYNVLLMTNEIHLDECY